MADPRFFVNRGPHRLGSLAAIAEAELAPDSDPDLLLHDVAPIDGASARDVTFLDNMRYAQALEASTAGACVLVARMAPRAPPGMALLLSDRPLSAYAAIARAFYPQPELEASTHPSAVIDDTASVSAGCRIEACSVIGARAEIGAGVWIGPQVAIGPGVVVGDHTRIAAGVSLYHCLVGASCQIHAGARIGERGFGFAMEADGFIDVPQLGRVVIEDNVEIGANTTIDRGAGPDTVIGAGSKIDNQVQLGHNVRLGKHCVVVAQAGVAGSTILEDQVVLAAKAGVSGHLRLARGAQVAADAGVMKNVGPGETVGGSPAVPIRQWLRQHAVLAKFAGARTKGQTDD